MTIYTTKKEPGLKKHMFGKHIFAVAFKRQLNKVFVFVHMFVQKEHRFWGYEAIWVKNHLHCYLGFGPLMMLYWQKDG